MMHPILIIIIFIISFRIVQVFTFPNCLANIFSPTSNRLLFKRGPRLMFSKVLPIYLSFHSTPTAPLFIHLCTVQSEAPHKYLNTSQSWHTTKKVSKNATRAILTRKREILALPGFSSTPQSCHTCGFDDKSAYATREILTTNVRKSTYFGEIGGKISLYMGILVTFGHFCSQYQIHKKILAWSDPPPLPVFSRVLLSFGSIFKLSNPQKKSWQGQNQHINNMWHKTI